MEFPVAVVVVKVSPSNLNMSAYSLQIFLMSSVPSAIWFNLNFSFSSCHLLTLIVLERILKFWL